MEKSPTCSDCNVKMAAGFMPDHFVAITLSHWHPGLVDKTFIGNVKLDRNSMIPITAFRCPECGQLKQYANNPSENPETNAG
jgi:hypothetical protein